MVGGGGVGGEGRRGEERVSFGNVSEGGIRNKPRFYERSDEIHNNNNKKRKIARGDETLDREDLKNGGLFLSGLHFFFSCSFPFVLSKEVRTIIEICLLTIIQNPHLVFVIHLGDCFVSFCSVWGALVETPKNKKQERKRKRWLFEIKIQHQHTQNTKKKLKKKHFFFFCSLEKVKHSKQKQESFQRETFPPPPPPTLLLSRLLGKRLLPLFDPSFHFRAEMADKPLNWPGSSISQSADRVSFNLERGR